MGDADLSRRVIGLVIEVHRQPGPVDNCLIIEVKSVDHINSVHEAQLLTYLRLSGIPLGLLLNFNCPVLKDGIRRRRL